MVLFQLAYEHVGIGGSNQGACGCDIRIMVDDVIETKFLGRTIWLRTIRKTVMGN